MDKTTGDARNEELVVNLELDDRVKLLFAGLKHAIKFLSLGNRPWETVEHKATKKR